MNPWIGNIIFSIGAIASVVIRIPHDKISQKTRISENRRGALEIVLMALIGLGMFLLPILGFTPILEFANYPSSAAAVVAGTLMLIASLWLFFKSHADLGKNWSMTLQIREEHALVSNGVYKSIRHPMYTSIFLLSFAQLLLLSNWISAPALLIAFSILFAIRLRTEEQMMLDKFGAQYESYRQKTKRIIPGVW